MAVLKPFRAVRPARKYAEEMVSPPYDVVDRESAAALAAGKPHSFLHICRAEIDLPEEVGAYEPQVYEKARDNIAAFLEAGVLLREAVPCYYIYRQEAYGKARTGLVGGVSVDDYLGNTIKKHEVTLAEKEEDRVRHFDVCSCHTEPVLLAYRFHEPLAELLDTWTEENQPEYNVKDAAGVVHQLWPVSDADTITAIEKTFAAMDYLYIADGHHRCASSARVGLKQREARPDFTGEENFNFFMAACFPEDELDIWDYSRMVKDLNGSTPAEFIEKLRAAGFTVEPAPASPYVPEEKHCFGLNLGGTWYKMEAKEALLSEDVIDGLDVSILQNHVLEPILGISDPRRDKRIAFVGGQDSLDVIAALVGKDGQPGDGAMAAAILLYPVAMEDIMAVADQGKIMPPKSTWFEPKLGSGLFLHEF